MTIDERSRAIWVAGGDSGMIYAYDLGGELVGEWEVIGKKERDGRSRLKSIVSTPYRVVCMDAYESLFYWLPVGSSVYGGEAYDGRVFTNETVRSVEIGGDWKKIGKGVNAGGVEWTERFEPEDSFYVVNSASGDLFALDLDFEDRKGVVNKAKRIEVVNGSIPGGLKGANMLKFDSIYEAQLYVLRGGENEVKVLEFPDPKNKYEVGYLDTLKDERFDNPAGIGEYGAWLFLPDAKLGLSEKEREKARFNVNKIRRWFRSESGGAGPVGDDGQIGSDQPPPSINASAASAASPRPGILPSTGAGLAVDSPGTEVVKPSGIPTVPTDENEGEVDAVDPDDDEDDDDDADESANPSGSAEVDAESDSDAGGNPGIFTDGTGTITQEEGKCFPADATVELESGKFVSMNMLNIGDKVRVDPSEKRFSEVFLFTHREPHSINKFVVIQAADGSLLRLSPGHYLYTNGNLVAAEHVRVGDTIETVRSSEKRSRVLSTKMTLSRGLYNPQTLDGDIVVNGVRTSTFTTAFQPRIARWLLSSLQVFYNKVTRPVFDKLLHNGCAKCTRFLPAGLAMYRMK